MEYALRAIMLHIVDSLVILTIRFGFAKCSMIMIHLPILPYRIKDLTNILPMKLLKVLKKTIRNIKDYARIVRDATHANFQNQMVEFGTAQNIAN